MLMDSISKSVAYQLDKWVLYTMNRRLPDSFEESYRYAPTFEMVLAQTSVNTSKTAVYHLSAPGEHPIWLDTMNGELRCHVRVQPAADPLAPLVLYHHGLNETPYTHSWRRIFHHPIPAHAVCVQAPFHSNWMAPFNQGFASLQNVYQMFAGSLRIMELLHAHFQVSGSSYTVASGVSWGGITSLIYEGIFQQNRVVIPMLAAPNLAQVMWDIATLFMRPIPIPQSALEELLDFTPYFRRCAPERVFPLLGENDLFFRLENHADAFDDHDLVTIPDGHITGHWKAERLRQHVLEVLAQAENGLDKPLPRSLP